MCPLSKKSLSKNQVIQPHLNPDTSFHELLKHLLFMSLEQESIKILICEWTLLITSLWILISFLTK